jgi:hypothetical protein
MQNRTTAIILTVAAVLLCGCPGLAVCVFGGLVIFGVPFSTSLNNGPSTTQPLPIPYGIGSLCGAVILVAIPIVVGVLTLRKKKTSEAIPVDVLPPQDPLPPAS